MAISIIDTNQNTTSKLPQLKALGINTVIRYLTTNLTGGKAVKEPEAKAIAKAGMKLGLVFQIYGGVDNFKHADISAKSGTTHAKFCLGYAPKVGAPDGAIIYFAIDTDASAAQITSLVIPYFKAVKATLGSKYRVGVYGSGLTCTKVADAGLAVATWLSCSMGWRDSRTYLGANKHTLVQYLPRAIAGMDADPDEVNPARPDAGFFVPFAGSAEPVPPPVTGPVYLAETPETFKILQSKLNKLGIVTPPLDEDGDFGRKTLTAIMAAVDKLIEVDERVAQNFDMQP